MNKKKSKALAFLLAASLLVPSANGIVSAAELRNDNSQYQELRRDISEDTVAIINGTEYKTLEEAINKVESNQTIQIVKDIYINKIFDLTNKENITIEGIIVNEKKPVLKINGQKGNVTFTVGERFSIKNIEMRVVEEDLQDTIIRVNKEVQSISIENCDFSVDEKCKYITNLVQAGNCALILKNNNVMAPALRAFVNPSNGSKIIGNSINLMESGKKNAAVSFSGTIDNAIIEENSFSKMDRAIGFDDAKTTGENIKINNNRFYELNWDFKLNMDSKFNKGAKFDFSGNYYEKDGVGSTPRIMDDKNDSEIKFEEYGDTNVTVGPCYGSSAMNPGDIVHAGVATVNGKDYPTLEKAIKAATEGTDKTVKLVSDITVDTWNQIWGIKGITLDGNEKTIKVTNKIESNQNHDSVLLSTGGNEFKNLIIDLSELKEGSKQQGVRAISASEGDKIENVTIKGNKFVSYGIVADEQCKNLEVKGSNISNCKHGIYFATENNNVGENISIDDNKFSDCEFAAILYPNKLYFINNELNNSSLNIVSDSVLVNHNIFDGNYKIEFYNSSEFRLNILRNPNNKIEFMGKNKNEIIDKMFMHPNYWGSENPNFNEIVIGGGLTEEQIETGFEPYYKDENRNELKGELHDINIASKGNGYTSTSPRYAKEGKKVIVELEPLAGWYLGTISSKDVVLNKESSSGKVLKYSFIMPNNDVNIKVEFKKNSSTSTPSKPSKPTYKHEEIIGSDRYDTAAKIADKLGSYDTVVLVNATSTMSDGLSASGLAGKENGAILLTKKDSIPKVTMDRIKKVKKVYIIGGESAISAKVAKEITAANIKVERLGGKTRVETSELVAKKLGNYNKAFVVNGFKGEADAMSASAVAAKNGAPILLTNGKSSTHAKKAGVEYYVIGGNTVVDKSIVSKYDAERLAGSDRYATNREVMDEFYSGKEKVYIANGDKLVDALTASPLAKNNGIVLVNKKSDKSILKGKDTVQVGGMDFEIDFE